MLIVALVVIAVLLIWSAAAIATALLAGGIIHERDHRDVRCSGLPAEALR